MYIEVTSTRLIAVSEENRSHVDTVYVIRQAVFHTCIMQK